MSTAHRSELRVLASSAFLVLALLCSSSHALVQYRTLGLAMDDGEVLSIDASPSSDAAAMTRVSLRSMESASSGTEVVLAEKLLDDLGGRASYGSGSGGWVCVLERATGLVLLAGTPGQSASRQIELQAIGVQLSSGESVEAHLPSSPSVLVLDDYAYLCGDGRIAGMGPSIWFLKVSVKGLLAGEELGHASLVCEGGMDPRLVLGGQGLLCSVRGFYKGMDRAVSHSLLRVFRHDGLVGSWHLLDGLSSEIAVQNQYEFCFYGGYLYVVTAEEAKVPRRLVCSDQDVRHVTLYQAQVEGAWTSVDGFSPTEVTLQRADDLLWVLPVSIGVPTKLNVVLSGEGGGWKFLPVSASK